MRRRSFLSLLPTAARTVAAEPPPPNVVVILADDVGYGDLSCYGATRVRTPNLDRLATRGLRFTDAHSSSATCTPTRYSLLTGEYAWRRPGTGILPGDAPLIIEPGRLTVPELFRRAGYATGCVGKWHLGLGGGTVDWNGEIKPGPKEVGFDESFIIPATGDRVPCVYVENGRVAGLDPRDPIRVSYGEKVGTEPTGKERPDLLRMRSSKGHDDTIVNGIGRIGFMEGGRAARWVDEEMAGTLTRRAVSFVERNRRRPFFLYFATHDIHVPRVPHRRFAGRSACGVRCDAIQQLDASMGELLRALERQRLAENTLVIFTSDNGPVVDDGYADRAAEQINSHTPSGALRGGKYSLHEGGTRLPFLACWPRRIRPGVSDALVSQVDLLASFAALLGRPLPREAGPDSLDMLAALLGTSTTGRETLVEHGEGLALRQGAWKLLTMPRTPRRSQPVVELYDLARDPSETRNVAGAHPERVQAMQRLLAELQATGRSRP